MSWVLAVAAWVKCRAALPIVDRNPVAVALPRHLARQERQQALPPRDFVLPVHPTVRLLAASGSSEVHPRGWRVVVVAVAVERPRDWRVVVAAVEHPRDCLLAVLVRFVE